MKSRGDILGSGDFVELKVQFANTSGTPADLDAIPQIQIVQPDNTIYMGFTSAGVYKISDGTYGFQLQIPVNAIQGVWMDQWQGTMNGEAAVGTFNFIVFNSAIANHLDGYEQLGDDPKECYSQEAIHNINKLMKMLKVQLQSSGRHQPA